MHTERVTALLISILVLTAPATRAAPATAALVEKEGRRLAVMENEWVRLEVDAARGARISSFVVKRLNREMVTTPGSGLYMDHVYEQNWPGEFLGAPYDVEVVASGPTQAVVRATRLATGDWAGAVNAGIAGLRVTRTLTLPADRPVVECLVEMKNTDTASKQFTFWQQNCYRADGDSGAESRQVMTHPSARGLHVVGKGNDWTRNAVAGWTAGVDPKDRVGLAFLMDYNGLWSLYNCGLTSSEWFLDKVLLPGQMSWTTRSSVMLVEGLEAVIHASPRLATDIQVSARDGALCVEHALAAPAAPLGKAKVTTTLAWLNGSLAIGAQPSTTEVPGIGREPQRVKADFPGQAGKPFIIQVQAEGEGWKESYEFAYGGAGTGKEPGKQVEGYAKAAPPKHQQIIKPPVLTKVRNERPRIMHLRGLYFKLWQVEAAAEALGPHDLTVSWYKDTGDIKILSVPPWDYEGIMKQDVIVLNNIGYGAMIGEQGAGMLKAYVEAGGALLFLGGPQAFGRGDYHQSAALKGLLPVELADAYDLKSVGSEQLAAAAGAPLEKALAGKPLGSVFWMHPIKAKPEAEVWAAAGKQPAIVTQQVGKGRVAVVLLTPLGEPPRRLLGWGKPDTPYWDSPAWPAAMTRLLRWLAGPS